MLSQFLSCRLAEGEGGRKERAGGKGSPVWPVRRYIYILPAGGEAGGSCLPSQLTHIQAAKYPSAVLRRRHHQTPCVSGGKEAAVNPSGRRLTSGWLTAPALAVALLAWLPSAFIVRAGGNSRVKALTHSLTGKSANTGAAGHGKVGGPPRTWPHGYKQVCPEPESCSDPPRISGC